MSTTIPDNATIGDKYRPAMKITDQAEADEYFESLVQWLMRKVDPETGHNYTRQAAEMVEKSNLGYFSGYYDGQTMERVSKLFKCAHPVFGTAVPTSPSEAMEAGKLAAREKG